MRFRTALFGALVIGTSGAFFACGSRTALPGDFDAVSTGDDDSGADVRKIRDTGPDTNPPPIDARPPRDANRDDCPDADATLVYLITQQNQLLSFFPTDGSFTLIGTISCPTSDPADNPFSMAVDRKGLAYVEFQSGNVFKVSTVTGACTATSYVPNQLNFSGFGMGFATIGAGPAETLYIAGGSLGQASAANNDLGSINVTTFKATDIGPFTPFLDNPELTGTGDGRLFAFWTNTDDLSTHISQVDKNTGDIIGSDTLPGITVGGAWAFGFWGGKFYTFTAPDGPNTNSHVDEFDPVTKNIRSVAIYPGSIVGAGVSTCAPQE